MKIFIAISVLLAFVMISCSYLLSHPEEVKEVEQAVEKEVEVLLDSSKVS